VVDIADNVERAQQPVLVAMQVGDDADLHATAPLSICPEAAVPT
jgi:hypothetical protein